MFHYVLRTHALKIWGLIAASLIFYATWDVRFVAILLVTALADFFLAKQIALTPSALAKRCLLIISLTLNLGMLCYFKYLNFFIGSFKSLAGMPEGHNFVDVVIPLGISFYTFQSMAYVIDVYRIRVMARKTPRDFLAAVSFFPHLLAGPLIRVQTLFPQFESVPKMDGEKLRHGIFLIAIGLSKKTIADMLSVVSDSAFGATDLTGMKSWAGAVAFLGQMYGDFSGYTDIALGSALILGFELPRNFYLPFFARSPGEYYAERWHISLATWIKEYLYTPLALWLSRKSSKLLWIAPLVTMLLMGLWHGANLTFILWGAYVGMLLLVSYFIFPLFTRIPTVILAVVTQYLVLVGLVIFRSVSVDKAISYLKVLHTTFNYVEKDIFYLSMSFLGLLFCVFLSILTELKNSQKIVMWILAFFFFVFAFSFGGGRNNFIYFQF